MGFRSTLVRTRSKYISLIGALARREGCRISTVGSDNFVKRVGAGAVATDLAADHAAVGSGRDLRLVEPLPSEGGEHIPVLGGAPAARHDVRPLRRG